MPYLSDRQYGVLSHRRLLVKLKNSSTITRRLRLSNKLKVHRGCVNTICWNENGSTILSGSDDQHLIVTDPYTAKVLTSVHSGHRENIFSAKFLPETNDRRAVSCSGDGIIFHTNFDRPNQSHSNEGCFTCHGAATAYEVRVIPHTPNLFFSCSDDCTVRLYDLRTKSNCLKAHCNDDVIIRSKWGITSIDINPMNPNEIVCACSDSSVRLYDHRKLSTQLSSDPSVFRRGEASIDGLISRFVLTERKEKRPPRITSVVFNQHGTEILTSYSSESLYLLDPKQSTTQEQTQERLNQHRNEKNARINTDEPKPTANESSPEDDKKTSRFKRLRLRGDWSDTGPNSRPLRDQQSQTSSNPNNPPQQQEEQQQQQQQEQQQPAQQNEEQSTSRQRNIQNIFMQRMSDILTQLVAPLERENEQREPTPTDSDDNNDDNTTSTNDNHNNISTSNTTETNTADNESTSTTTVPIVQSPPSPTSNESSESATITTNESESATTTTNESESGRERLGFFDILFGRNRRTNDLGEDNDEDDDDDDDDDDENCMDDDTVNEDNENSQASSSSSAATTDNPQPSGRARRPLMASKWDRLMKRRENERRHEENLLKSVPSLGLINSYDGHRNARTMIKEANFWSDSYVMSGSDCGHIFFWNKFTSNIVRIIQADEHVVNCVQPHPLNYPILASSGIDYDIKLFLPSAEAPVDDSELIRNTIKRNHAMMEETSSTITVPATFMFRMLTSFYRLRRPEGLFGTDDDDDE